jgi:hypothetical protein
VIRDPDRSARPRGGVSSLQAELSTFLRASGLDAHIRHWKVFEAWSKALGAELGKRARAVRFQNGELTVEVESAAHLHELRNFTGEGFRRAANAHLEKGDRRDSIRRIAFKLKS